MTATVEGHVANPPSPRKLALLVAGDDETAGVITVCAVLPAEFHLDPTGFGTATGLMGLSAAPEAKSAPAASTQRGTPAVLAREYPTPFRTDTIDIPLKGADSTGSELEYKVKMKAGLTLDTLPQTPEQITVEGRRKR